MKKFVLLFHGYGPPTPEIQTAWKDWLHRRAASVVDVGNPFGAGRLVTNNRTTDLTLSSNRASGYSIVTAPHLDAAEQLLEGCPVVDSISFYEALEAEIDLKKHN